MFAFATPLSASILKTIKTGLANSLPNVKSSHRCEAAARGLGFKSHAALLATLKDSSIIVVQADAARFKSYLSIHQFDVTPEPFYLSVGRVLMMKVLETEPRLTSWGYGIGKRERDLDGKRPTIEEHIQKFTVERNYLLRDSAIQEFLQALAFLSKVQPSKTISTAAGSYRLKHIAENFCAQYPTGERIQTNYVSNGAMIAAAIHRGFRYRRHQDGFGDYSINVSFNMAKSLVRKLDKEIRNLDYL